MNGKINTALLLVCILGLLISLIFSYLAYQRSYSINIPAQNYFVPDKNKWASLVIKDNITSLTNLWADRYVVNAVIFEQDKEIVVIVTTANGENIIKDKEYVERLITPAIKNSIDQLPWLKDYKLNLTIQ